MRTVRRLAVTGLLVSGSLLVIVASPAVAQTHSRAGTAPLRIVNFREGSAFTGISCLSANDCISAGTSSRVNLSGSRTYVQVWNGSQWLAEPSANEEAEAPYNDNNLNAVSCTSSNFCMAVGTYSGGGYEAIDQTLAETWNGTEWSILSTPDAGTNSNNILYGVSCTSPSFCVAVGYDPANVESAMIEMWDGSSWTLEPSSGPNGGVLNGVTCLGSTGSDCVAVGDIPTSSGSSETLIMSWDGTSWSVGSSPNPDTGFNTLNGVSCTGPSDCLAAGFANNINTSPYDTLIETWNGSSWSVTQSNSGTADAQLDGISCSSSDASTGCLAVGHILGGADTTTPYAELWDGSVWSAVSIPNLRNGGVLASSECSSPTSCIAVGYTGVGTLAETLSGSSLSRMPTPNQPAIAGSKPKKAAPGATVELVGRQFADATSVTFNGVAGTITEESNTTIDVTVPATATSGYIVVTTPGGTATSPSVFDVT